MVSIIASLINIHYVFIQGQFLPFSIVITCICVCSMCEPQACPCDNSSPDQARIPKFHQKMKNTLAKIHIILGVDWPRPSRSNLKVQMSYFAQFHHQNKYNQYNKYIIAITT